MERNTVVESVIAEVLAMSDWEVDCCLAQEVMGWQLLPTGMYRMRDGSANPFYFGDKPEEREIYRWHRKLTEEEIEARGLSLHPMLCWESKMEERSWHPTTNRTVSEEVRNHMFDPDNEYVRILTLLAINEQRRNLSDAELTYSEYEPGNPKLYAEMISIIPRISANHECRACLICQRVTMLTANANEHFVSVSR